MKIGIRFLFFLILSILTFPIFSQEDNLTLDKKEIPPKTYVKKLMKESDAALKVKITGIHLDSCKTCTSTGVLYIIEADILKKYFVKRKKIKENHLIYMSAANTSLYDKSKEIIIFLNRVKKQDRGKFKSISWSAAQATEFNYSAETESFIDEK